MQQDNNSAYTRLELGDMLPTYRMIDHCIAGQRIIKRYNTLYLPKPNPTDTSSANDWRYTHYLERAVFYNVTGRTLAGLMGLLFLREPTITLPTGLELLAESSNGIELGLAQLVRRAAEYTISKGRAGIFTDFPDITGKVLTKDTASEIAPIIRVYNPENVLNWRVGRRNGRKILTMVLLRELVDVDVVKPDDLNTLQLYRYRMLTLENDIFTVRSWTEGEDNAVVFVPKNYTGATFSEIPFSFVGSTNNDEEIDVPPLEAIAVLNIAHYRNSADYQESCFYSGQPTAYFAGLTEDWIHSVFNDAPIMLGARSAIPLPQGASAGMLQPTPNTMPFESMQALERQMVALGASLVQQQAVQRTAAEANQENSADTSILGSIANNVSEAMEAALSRACQYTGDDASTIEFKLNTNLGYVSMSAQDRQQLIAEWQNNAISFNEMRTQLREAGIATEDDDKVLAEGQQIEADKQQKQMDMLAAQAAVKQPVQGNVA